MLRQAQMIFIFFTLSLIRFCDCYINNDGMVNDETQSEEYQVITDVDKNITLACWPKLFPKKSNLSPWLFRVHLQDPQHPEYRDTGASVYWEKTGERREGERVLPDGSLLLLSLMRSDTKLYVCRTSDTDLILTKIHLYIRGPPDPPSNVTVETSMLDALVSWFQPIDSSWQTEMGGVDTSMIIRYHIVGSTFWQQFPNSLPSSQNHIHIHGLKPNSTYEFEICAQNKYGASASVFVLSRTKPDYREVELSYRLLQTSNEANPRVWLLSLVVLLLAVNALGTFVLVVYSKRNRLLSRRRREDPENIELVPNIIENPSYPTEAELQVLRPDLSNKSSSNFALNSHSEFV